ncbi:hypothetical protein [Truepera radiovictrix]|uniref:Flp pilus assembly protein n=1 Tax=Truepera radiovictrix (strain DSM 17093 / CIP 108686 / LMG 22925 / RQ-24) TaxID=649638 RepID=D7CQR0_TRURR|nr:hypothetical protein [Truepera radiovictrix]ADI15044.1 putative Flp pilus assembly protein [Truepera radiovictrix DSM 17093]WMT56403.1 pilus assembly protein [Truepera radiovictrix]
MLALYNLHNFYGEFLQLVPIVVLIWFAVRRRTPLQRVAPVLLDINVLIGFLLYLTSGIRVSVWHPVFMLAAIGLAHGVARSTNRKLVIGAWVGVLVLVALGVQIAGGRFLTRPLLPAL